MVSAHVPSAHVGAPDPIPPFHSFLSFPILTVPINKTGQEKSQTLQEHLKKTKQKKTFIIIVLL